MPHHARCSRSRSHRHGARTGRARSRGLSPGDLAMHVVLPEVDGRLFAGVVSFKSAAMRDPDLQFSHLAHRPDEERVKAVAARVAAWRRLAETPAAEKRVALVLSNYPGRPHQIAHAVGLDALASVEALVSDLAEAGFDRRSGPCARRDVAQADLELERCRLPRWRSRAFRKPCRMISRKPGARRRPIRAVATARSISPRFDAAGRSSRFSRSVAMRPRAMPTITISPARRATPMSRSISGSGSRAVDAVVHIGAHGTLEWLPGKSVALSAACWPEALIGDLPVIYPFIVNDPGEAAQAKRRIGAVTIGHLPPPLAASAVPDGLRRLERAARRILDGRWPRSRPPPAPDRRDIRDEARAAGLEDDLGLDAAAAPAEAIPRIDRFVCDLKESQFGDGLHVFGRGDLRRRGARRVAGRARGTARRAGAVGLAVSRRARTCCRPDAISLPSIRARCRRRRRMRKASGSPKNCCVAICRITATGRRASWSISGARRRCAPPARSSPWRCIWPASRRAGITLPAASPATTSSRLPSSAGPGSTSRCACRACSAMSSPASRNCSRQAAEALARARTRATENPYRHRASRVFAPRPGQYGVGLSAIPRCLYGRDARCRRRSLARRHRPWAFSARRRDAARSCRHRDAARIRRCFRPRAGSAGDRSSARRGLCRA